MPCWPEDVVAVEITASDRALAEALMTLPGTRAVAIGGSRASGLADAASDTDAYALVSGPVPAAGLRAQALRALADDATVSAHEAFGPEDHLVVGGRLVEVVYLQTDVLSEQVAAATGEGLMSEGFTTCFLHTLATCVPVADDGALAGLRAQLATYPEPTRRRVLAQTPEILGECLKQLVTALERGDVLMVTHRRASVQALWFNMLFALNRVYHPGEKRLLEHASRLGTVPAGSGEAWRRAALLGADDERLAAVLTGLTRDLLALVEREQEPEPGA